MLQMENYKMIKYEKIEATDLTSEIIKATDGDIEFWIPTDPANSYYQAYLASLDETSTL
jgi:hypothetical protein